MKTKNTFKRFSQTLLAATLIAGLGAAQALPTGQTVLGGSATITSTGPSGLNVMSTAPSTVISWSGFDVAANEAVGFNQNPLATGGNTHVLNIINSGAASNIQGVLSAGTSGVNVYFVNPNGFVLNAPAAGTAVGNSPATGVASTLNFSNSAVTASQFMTSGAAAVTPQITINPSTPVSSMSGINIPAGTVTPPIQNGGTTPTPATNPFSLAMTPAEFAAALQTLDPSVLNTIQTSSALGALFQGFLTNGCLANPANAACSAAIFHLLSFLSDPANFGGLLASGGGGTGGGTGGITLANNPALGPLVGAVPGLNSYLALFNAAQNAAFNQLQTYLNQNPGYAQYAANTIAQAAPQATAQAQAAMGQAMQQVRASGAPAQAIAAAQNMLGAAPGMINAVLMGASQSLANGGVPGLQNFLFGNTLNASFSNGVVNLGM
ncbi:MAG: filamentous hemagglutinin N-terminal domain-containing protein [Pseudomonadota bacterium]